MTLGEEQLDAIRRINHTVVNPDGTVKSFKEQLLEYEYGYFNALMPFVVMADSSPLLQAGAQNYPITMDADLDKRTGTIAVNEFKSIYKRGNIEHTINETWRLGFHLFPNDKTERWLQSNGLQLPAHLASVLNGNYREV